MVGSVPTINYKRGIGVSSHKEIVRKLVAYFGDLVESLRKTGMEINIGERRSAEDTGVVHLVAIVKPLTTESGVTGTYEITRKQIRGTAEMAELFTFTIVPGFTGYGSEFGTQELQKEFQNWIGKTIEQRIAEKARKHFVSLVDMPEGNGKSLILPDPIATAEAIKSSLGQFMQEWHESVSLREEFAFEFLSAKRAWEHAKETDVQCKARAEKILAKF